MKDFNQRLKKLFKDNKLSQVDFGKRTGASTAYVNHLLNGRRDPNYQDLKNIMEVFPDTDMNYLLGAREFATGVVSEPREDYPGVDHLGAIDHYLNLAKEQVAKLKATQE